MQKKKKSAFWNQQYKRPTHLKLSTEPSEDLEKFTRWLMREFGKKFLNVTTMAVDLGCGNGRNLIYLSENFGVFGVGYDTSREAILQARARTEASQLPLVFEERSIAKPIPIGDASVTIALDMMSSHVLREAEREALRNDVVRILKPGGWLFLKTFLNEEDQHAERLLKENPGPEEGMYLHPEIGVAEYVWTENAIREFYEPFFTIRKIEKSHKHEHADGRAWKRRTVSVYLEKSV